LAALDLKAIANTSLIADALTIAAGYSISAYDACYVPPLSMSEYL
jgi:predicted nucleic acid-binding protein